MNCEVLEEMPDVFEHPQTQARDLKVELEHPTAGVTSFLGIPYKMSNTPAEVRQPPPLLGEHTEEVLMETLAYSAEEVSSLQNRNAI